MICSYMNFDNLVVGGDLNFLLGISEILGLHAHLKPLSDFFTHVLEVQKLYNVY